MSFILGLIIGAAGVFVVLHLFPAATLAEANKLAAAAQKAAAKILPK